MDAHQVRRRHEKELMALPNVNGVTVVADPDTGEDVVQVFVTHKVPLSQLSSQDVVPEALEGVRVDVVEMGDFSIESSDRGDPGKGN